MENEKLESLLIWLPIGLSVLALLVTATFSWISQTDQKLAARLNREKDLHSWATQIADIYVHLLGGDPTEKKNACFRLSVLIDYGRLLFPNEKTSRALQEYDKGRRSSVLDPLVESVCRCE